MAKAVCENWQIDAVFTAQTGTPVSVFYLEPFDFGTYIARPDAVTGAPMWVAASSSPGGDTWTHMRLSYRTRRVPELSDATPYEHFLSVSGHALSRPIRLSQRLVTQLRFDAFNVFNTPNFGPPNVLFLI